MVSDDLSHIRKTRKLFSRVDLPFKGGGGGQISNWAFYSVFIPQVYAQRVTYLGILTWGCHKTNPPDFGYLQGSFMEDPQIESSHLGI